MLYKYVNFSKIPIKLLKKCAGQTVIKLSSFKNLLNIPFKAKLGDGNNMQNRNIRGLSLV